MFSIGDVIVYGAQGVCKISCIEAKQIGKENINYYVLNPLFNENTSVFVPVDNTILTYKMKNVLTVSQAKQLIKSASSIDVLKYANENQKREQYKEILASSNRERLVSLIKTIRAERDDRRSVGKRLNLHDEQALSKAEQLLFGELAFVLQKEMQEIEGLMKI